ncbi:dihydrolipoamide acetyltransferase family protein [Mucilaginibacter auburnensis]|uniref:Dihydrolipoamide acetyltransferase component of pyruvate dehydrogenase complex n=1 Tax=Mucilaginibacter auburnensis TaxID=1457233 RepID=A0A2H9VLG5_9SPHI|nr:dihydrolipoamide acetyltransferase family protein [Mucilaginibacter auburnensis]PJJ79163.1 2-oxoglutarate dehydrogenase E2 component (dihydrolipoamide succinyltransferase) [Mucilaginibacter auburnensis]
MARYQLLLPKMGESVAEATIIKWVKKPGDYIEADEAVIEIATDKVDSEVPSPVSGKLVEQRCKEDDIVQVGDVVAVIETEEEDTSAESTVAQSTVVEQLPAEESQRDVKAVATEEKKHEVFFTPPTTHIQEEVKPEFAEEDQAAIPGIDQLQQANTSPAQRPFKDVPRFYSPLVKHIASQENVSAAELDNIAGSGAEGRLTKDDLLNYLRNRPANTTSPTKAPAQPEQPKQEEVKADEPQARYTSVSFQQEVKATANTFATSVSGSDEIIEMDRMRRLIAEHMVMSKQTSPHVTSFVEADVTGLVLWRERIKNTFEKREGEKITFTPIFMEAVVKAIKDFPLINSSVNGTQIIRKAAINISMATALPNGNLIVPVIKKADELNLLGLTKAVNGLAGKARLNKLQPDDVKDGTFTITNVGTFGNLMGTPIINQPQVAILAIGAIKKKPAVIETPEGDVIAIRHMMFLSLSYDHRVIDGSLGGSFVKRIADYLENWDVSREV